MDKAKRQALALSKSGRQQEAVALLRQLIADREHSRGEADFDDYMLLAGCLFNDGQLEETASSLARAATLFPDQPEVHENLGVVLLRLRRPAEAIAALERALSLGSRSVNVHDTLCSAFGGLGQMDRAKEHGVKALLAKDAAACADGQAVAVPQKPPPPIDRTKPDCNIISFSLWGTDPRYINGALRNADLVPEIYPGWRARFYLDDSVPREATAQLERLSAEVVTRPAPRTFYEGLMWRFEVIGDRTIARFLVRDADSLINTQERAAVDEWLASGRYFHVMRDWYTHTDLILAGLWGGVGGVLPPLEQLTARFKPFRMNTRNYDQDFLRMAVWPTVRQSCLIHDSYFDCLGSRPFPPWGRLPAGAHVGQDWRSRALRTATARDLRR